MNDDEDNFVIVKRRKNKHTAKTNHIRIEADVADLELETNLQSLQLYIERAIEIVKSSNYLNLINDIVNNALMDSQIPKIMCYGIGHFSCSECSGTYQLALLILLKQHFKALVYVQEPILFPSEIEFLTNNDITFVPGKDLSGNHFTSHSYDPQSKILYYIVHGHDSIYNGILEAHQDPKHRQNMIIVGNKIPTLYYASKDWRNLESWKTFYDGCQKLILPYFERFHIAFNDTCLMYLPKIV